MDAKTEELIAIAVSYGVNCTFCMEFHKEKGKEVGLAEEDMLEAIDVAKMVKNGAANKTRNVSKELFGGGGSDEPGRCS